MISMSKFKSAHIIRQYAIAGHQMYDVVLLETEDFEPYKDIGGTFTGYTVATIGEALAIAASKNVPLYMNGEEIITMPVMGSK